MPIGACRYLGVPQGGVEASGDQDELGLELPKGGRWGWTPPEPLTPPETPLGPTNSPRDTPGTHNPCRDTPRDT